MKTPIIIFLIIIISFILGWNLSRFEYRYYNRFILDYNLSNLK